MIVTNPFNELHSWTRYQVERVSKGWWVLLITGLVTMVGGGIIVMHDWTVGDLAVFVSLLMMFQGFMTLFSWPVDGSGRGITIVSGLAQIGVAIAVLVWPGQTLLVLAFFVGWLLLFRGTMAVAGSLAARHVMPYWGWAFALGIGEILVSFYLLSRPALTLAATIMAIGLVAMFYGAVEVILAFEVKRIPKHLEDFTRSVSGVTQSRPLENANT
jgi:uncharacterized membrane protein HdeD (DUF308 family)